MRFFMGLLATALIGADAPSASKPKAEPKAVSLVYRVKFLDMKGLDWRSSLYSDLQTVTHQGGATVWTGPQSAVSTLSKTCERVVAAPTIAAVPGQPGTVMTSNKRVVLFDVTRQADGPVNRASYVTFDEKLGDEKEGVSISLRGRKIDQGVLATMVINDKQVTAIHPVTFTEEATQDGAPEPKMVRATIQVPELAQCEVAGEWLIPNDGVLIVSMGVHTTADSKGKAIVRERLALIEASEMKADSKAKPVVFPSSMPTKGYINVPASVQEVRPEPIPASKLPSRALPEARDASGEPVSLPPLPAMTPITTLPGTSTPCATPQGMPTSSEWIKAKAETALDVEAIPSALCLDSVKSSSEVQPTTFRVRLPLIGPIHVEIRAMTRPASSDTKPD